jgi:manganese transport protein
MGESATGELLILSQVILSLQLGFAIIPLIHFVSDREKMGEFVVKNYIKVLAWISATIIVGLNAKLVAGTLIDWISAPGESISVLKIAVVAIAVLTGIVLLYITFHPFFSRRKKYTEPLPHGTFSELTSIIPEKYKRIAITVDFSNMDKRTISHALSQGGEEAEYLIVHVVETAGAFAFGKDIRDFETESDEKNLKMYSENLSTMGYKCSTAIGYGRPKIAIVEKVKEFNADMLVMGAHGHKALKDILLGTTVDAVRHALKIPVLVVR